METVTANSLDFIDIAIFFILIFLSAFFSGTETAFTSLNEMNIASIDGDESKLKLLQKLIKEKSKVISAILCGNNIVNTVTAVYAGLLTDDILQTFKINPYFAPVVASVVTITFLLIFGEVLPKQVGNVFAKTWAYYTARVVSFIIFLLRPIVWCMEYISTLVLKILPKSNEADMTAEEIQMIAYKSEEAGIIDKMGRKMVAKSNNLVTMQARDIMIPKQRIISLKESMSFDEIVKIFNSNMYTRMPVYKESLDNITGIFNYKECLKSLDNVNSFKLEEHLIKPIIVSENIHLGDLLDKMKKSLCHMAVILDEYSNTSGIVTMEDILERVIGLIGDEYNNSKQGRGIQRLDKDGNVAILDGSISLTDFSKLLKVIISDEEIESYRTLNGFLLHLNNEVFLKEGDKIRWQNINFTVTEVCNHFVKSVKFNRFNAENETENETVE